MAMNGPAIHAPAPIGNSLKACMMPLVATAWAWSSNEPVHDQDATKA